MKNSEYYLLEDFLYTAIYIPKGADAPLKNIIKSPELWVYVRDFGKSKHDLAIVAEINGNIEGAIWSRIMNDYGHIDDKTPSLAMAVNKEFRENGIGTELLKNMLVSLKAKDYPKVSLSVQKANYAVNMYKKAGFVIVKENKEEYIMAALLS